MNKKDCIVIDIECYSDYNINTEKVLYQENAKVKWIGLYSYKTNKYYEVLISGYPENKQKVIDFISKHNTIITFNGDNFDIPILKNIHNQILSDDKFFYSVDMWKVLGNDKTKGCKNRGALMGYDFKSNSLRNMAIEMNLETLKGDIDYTIFKKDYYTRTEISKIKKYLRGDIEVTKLMFDKCYDFWCPFTELLDRKNIKNWSWIKSTIACLVYKVACNLLNIEEEYANKIHKKSEIGGKVIEPKVNEARGVWYLDVNSMYPMIYIMFNLMAERYDGVGWHGNDEFKVNGYYDSDKYHKMSEILLNIYNKRLYLKNNDKKNPLIYVYKILLNTFYGANRNPVFKNIHTENSGEDCCRIGQKINDIMEKMLLMMGYQVIAGDTDSVFVVNDTKSKFDVLKDIKTIVEYIKSKAPFPKSEFNIAIEHDKPLDYIMFVSDGDKRLKKNYIYVVDNEVIIKGLPIIKNQATELGRLILNKYLKPRIVKELTGKFDKEWFDDIIQTELKNDITIISQEYKCKSVDYYGDNNCIWRQISQVYLEGQGGVIKLIKNNVIGKVGCDKNKYCTPDEAIEHGLKINNLNLEKIYNELKPFIKNYNEVSDKCQMNLDCY